MSLAYCFTISDLHRKSLIKKLIYIKQPREDLSNANKSINKNVKKKKKSVYPNKFGYSFLFNKYGNKILVIYGGKLFNKRAPHSAFPPPPIYV